MLNSIRASDKLKKGLKQKWNLIFFLILNFFYFSLNCEEFKQILPENVKYLNILKIFGSVNIQHRRKEMKMRNTRCASREKLSQTSKDVITRVLRC